MTWEGEGEVREGKVVCVFWKVLSAGDCREQVEGESLRQETSEDAGLTRKENEA